MKPVRPRGGTGADATPLAAGECQHNDDESVVGWRWQCEGHLFASIDFDAPLNKECVDILGDRCNEHHVFGPSNDTYEAPDVMACCGEYDPAYKDTYLEFCNYDLVQQVCISMAKRLEKLVKDGSFGIYTGQGSALQKWVAQNYSQCFAALVQNDSDPDPAVLVSQWKVPTEVVNENETARVRIYCSAGVCAVVSMVPSLGWLIQTSVGSGGGFGRPFGKRSGCAA
jgi:hypothetical protein